MLGWALGDTAVSESFLLLKEVPETHWFTEFNLGSILL